MVRRPFLGGYRRICAILSCEKCDHKSYDNSVRAMIVETIKIGKVCIY